MRALLLAAGLGTRLRPLTDTVPKCLVPIKGQPLLDIWLERLTAAGISRCLVNTHYLAPQVHAYLAGSRFASQVDIAEEKELLGTAGTLMANLPFFQGGDAMLIHADNYCLADFTAFLHAHASRPVHCLMTMMTFRTATPQTCGIVELDDAGVVVGFHEKVANPPGNLANGAIYILSAELLAMMAKDMPHVTDFSTEVMHHLVGKIYTHETTATFLDIGTPETYAQANAS
ncbi:nucleotidyltransferase family protein [Pseudoduganella ginsengisoli]|uniref:NTP transferase domain-containing protein n=1 Tax=Pseudoduganella ginsengisoli TaxID=1462440 RepID=A0A6L6PZT9_9BURK|nr:nucleotidyltransferase family protein [Pseudoduganella ginsengisoli]MTW02651.1 NTP transferase domain-containing protein [Pseudoduganella ginsengisoli]